MQILLAIIFTLGVGLLGFLLGKTMMLTFLLRDEINVLKRQVNDLYTMMQEESTTFENLLQYEEYEKSKRS